MTVTDKPNIGFIGIGAMGAPMASRLASAGYSLTVCDQNPARVQLLQEKYDVREVATPDKLAEKVDVVITILPNSAIVQEVLFGSDGMAGKLRAGTTIIEMTSGVPAATVKFHKDLLNQGVTLFDAPVSGGVPRAETGRLTIMVGGTDIMVNPVEPILNVLGNVTRTGSVGSGHAMKALNNLVSSAGFLIGIEALLIGSSIGINPEVMVDVLNSSTGMNNSTLNKFKQYVLSREFDSGFSLGLMTKDLTIALGIAHENQVNAPFSDLCRNLWAGANALLGSESDHTAVTLACERLTGSAINEGR
ncbi:MAG: NAD(P)-dependent oxidoreductase [Castellaniella sp.]